MFTLKSTLTLPVILLALLSPAGANESHSDFVGQSDPDVVNALKFSGQKRSVKDSLRLLDQASPDTLPLCHHRQTGSGSTKTAGRGKRPDGKKIKLTRLEQELGMR